MKKSESPFDDIRELILSVPPPHEAVGEAVLKNILSFPGPQPVLGEWQDRVPWLASWQNTIRPTIQSPLVAVFCGAHRVAENFISGSIRDAAQARVKSLSEGQSLIRGMSAHLGAAFKVFEMGLEHPVADITQEETLSEMECAAAIAFGMEVVAEGADIIALGNAGLGSATAAAAIAKTLYGGAADYWAGGLNNTAEARIRAVEMATERHKKISSYPLESLRVFGGRDIAGLVGAILAARHQGIPIILDGFIVCTAAAIIHAMNPDAISHCLAGHVTSEPAHGALLDRIGLKPTLKYNLPLGDGTGATYALSALAVSVSGYDSLMASE